MFTRHYNLDEANHRKLIWLAKAHKVTPDGPINADMLLNDILKQFFTKNFPQLDDAFQARAELDRTTIEQLEQTLADKATT